MPDCKRVVLSGGPGTGKTSLISELEKEGHVCFHEYSRIIIQDSLAKGSDILPWKDLTGFTDKVLNGRINQYKEAKAGLNFYDRSVVDSLAYMHKDHLEPEKNWIDYLSKFRYHPHVFISPPWREIFENDNERRESWPQLLQLHEYLMSTYQDAGYEIILLPKVSVQERVSFVMNSLK